jgi:catechol 2,3-dioxygenase-like lactoylglutathione lyase family enzyme
VKLGTPTPAMPTQDLERARAFYEGVLGFENVAAEPGFALLRRDGATVSLWGATDESWRDRDDWDRPVCSGAESFLAGTASFRLEVDGIDELYAQCDGHVHPNAALHETEWGTREFGVLDPDGNLIGFWERA